MNHYQIWNCQKSHMWWCNLAVHSGVFIKTQAEEIKNYFNHYVSSTVPFQKKSQKYLRVFQVNYNIIYLLKCYDKFCETMLLVARKNWNRLWSATKCVSSRCFFLSKKRHDKKRCLEIFQASKRKYTVQKLIPFVPIFTFILMIFRMSVTEC